MIELYAVNPKEHGYGLKQKDCVPTAVESCRQIGKLTMLYRGNTVAVLFAQT